MQWPSAAAAPQASITHSHKPATRRQLQPLSARPAEGASAWGIFETKTAARNAMLIGVPLAICTPKMTDSGTPSTIAPDDNAERTA